MSVLPIIGRASVTRDSVSLVLWRINPLIVVCVFFRRGRTDTIIVHTLTLLELLTSAWLIALISIIFEQ